jgi:hypothetical protein
MVPRAMGPFMGSSYQYLEDRERWPAVNLPRLQAGILTLDLFAKALDGAIDAPEYASLREHVGQLGHTSAMIIENLAHIARRMNRYAFVCGRQ